MPVLCSRPAAAGGVLAFVLALAPAGIPAAHAGGADGPGSCLTSATVGTTVGDLLSCALPEPEDGPAVGLRDGVSPERFAPAAGVDYAPLHGSTPDRAPFPARCSGTVRGSWTQDQGHVTSVTQDGDRTVFGFVLNSRWTTGFGAGGRATVLGDLWIEPGGFAVVVGREIYEGTIGGRTGSAVTWIVGHAFATGRYVAHAYSTGGTEGLAGLRLESDGVGLLGKGGHWAGGGRFCFAE